jgi:hypothetical protein
MNVLERCDEDTWNVAFAKNKKGQNLYFKKADAGLQKALGFFNLTSSKNKDRTEIFKLQSRMPINKGKLTFVDTVLKAEGLDGDIKGYVDIASRYVDTSGRFALPEIKLKDMPPITFHAKGPFANLVVENTAEKLKDYFLSNVVGSLAGKVVAQGLLSVLLPGVGTLIGAVAGEAIDSARDASVDAEIAKERQVRAENGSQPSLSSSPSPSSGAQPAAEASAQASAQPAPPPQQKHQKSLKGLEKELKKGLKGLFG